MMSNIFNWLNPHKLEFSILQTQAGEAFDIYLNPWTDTLYTRAPDEKWEKHPVKMNPFRYKNTGRVGIYTVAENGKERYFTVNLADESESDTNPVSLEHIPDQTEASLGSEEISAQHFLVMLAKAGIQSTQNRIFWIPAFAGMTVYIAINSPIAHLFSGLILTSATAYS
jgi:hypothetical protein